MINEKEIQISNKSYTNKDFPVIYLELLELIKKFTNKWDPATSNESDPGVVLVKLLAFIADKLNYNVDKNFLERFMLSATQATSMRELCEMMGYEMNYYVAAETELTFNFTSSGEESLNSSDDYFYIPQFTSVTSSNGDVHYLTKEAKMISSANNYSFKVMAIEGELHTLTVNDSEVITLDNLDDSLRIYFPVVNVAQNGIFITNVDTNTVWKRVSNLNAQPLGQPIYKFGFDSVKGQPYVEFPSDIISLIMSGLSIQYITTIGENGNVKAKYLTVLETPTTFYIKDDQSRPITFDNETGSASLSIVNLSASINGANPETIDDAYNNFKKTVGTFTTLVSCRDYANAIYTLTDLDELPLVSNVQVTDRRTDVNYACNIVTYDEYGVQVKNYPAKQLTVDGEYISAYDLCLYPLNPIITSTDVGTSQYVTSFQPLVSTQTIEAAIEGSKTISHDYIHTSSSSDIYAIKNYLTLNANISTLNKVYPYEQADIIRNIKKALMDNFNARKVDYGYEIPYDSILKVIQEADPRISNVALAEPELKTKVMKGDGSEYYLMEERDFDSICHLVAINILAGKMSLFNYDDDFNYDLGQSESGKITSLKSVTTEFALPQTNLHNYYTLQDNEVIQLLAPSYLDADNYGAYINFCFYRNTGLNTKIPNGTIYKLANEEYLYFTYEQNGAVKFDIYGPGSIIQPVGFDLFAYDENAQYGDDLYRPIKKKTLAELNNPNIPGSVPGVSPGYISAEAIEGTNPQAWRYIFFTLKASESIIIKKKNEVELTKPVYCYWLVNSEDNQLFKNEETSRMLEDGEYFFYTDNDFMNLISVGGGTTIKITGVTSSKNWKVEPISLVDIEEKGLLSLRDKWDRLQFSTDGKLTIQENTILTLTAKDKLVIPGLTLSEGDKLSNTPVSFTKEGSIKYIIEGQSEETLNDLNIPEDNWLIKSRLDINASRTKFQQCLSNHSISFESIDGLPHPIDPGIRFNLSELVQVAGGDNIDLGQFDIVSGEPIYPLSLYQYQQQDTDLFRDSSGFARILFNEEDSAVSYAVPRLNAEEFLMLYWLPTETSDVTLNVSVGEGKELYRYNSDNNPITSIPKGINTVWFENSQGIESISFELSVNLSDYDGTLTYSIGDLVRNGGQAYICKEEITTPESFDSNKWDHISESDVIRLTGSSGVLLIGQFKVTKQGDETGIYNPLIGLSSAYFESENGVLAKIKTYDKDQVFYYTNEINNDNAINLDANTLFISPYTFYDFNNVANRFTLSEIDFESSIISIARSSRK